MKYYYYLKPEYYVLYSLTNDTKLFTNYTDNELHIVSDFDAYRIYLQHTHKESHSTN